MSEEYPVLGEQGEKEAQLYLDDFKNKMHKVADEVLGEVYVNCIPYIDSDSWLNFRNHVREWIRGYRKLDEHDAKMVREAIYKEYRDDIIKDLNQDHLKRIKDLEEHIEMLRSNY